MNPIAKMINTILVYTCNMPDTDCNHNCEICKYYVPNTFTPEKQLEIMKIIGQRYEVTYTFDFEGNWAFSIIDEHIVVHNEDFAKALANLVIKLYSDLTPNLKQQIKEILEG